MAETLACMNHPREPWTRLRSNNMLKRIMKEIRRRKRVAGAFPDRNSALLLVAARRRHVAGTKWGTRRYFEMLRLREIAEGCEKLPVPEPAAPEETLPFAPWRASLPVFSLPRPFGYGRAASVSSNAMFQTVRLAVLR